MSTKALFTYNYCEKHMNSIKKLGYDVKIINEDIVKYNNELENIEVLVCYNPFDKLDISKMKKLKWIQLSSTGVDQLPKEIINKNSIVVTNNKNGYGIPIAEWIVLNILEMYKNSKKLFKQQKDKIWKIDKSILELYGKTIGFIGTGDIAIESCKRLKGFEVKLLGVNTTGKETQYFDKCYSIHNINDMLPQCDTIVVTVPFTKFTKNMIDYKVFSKMKSGVYFVNVSRGQVVNENALINNLKSKKVKFAAIDVVEKEPLEKDSELWDLHNVIITPHNSWISEMRNVRRFEGIYENMKRYVEKKELINIVDIKKGY